MSSIAFSYQGNYHLSDVPALPTTVPPGGSFSFNVTFAPATSGWEYNAVSISCNDPDDPNPYIWMYGNGIDPMVITPGDDLSSVGIIGGPFSPESKTYTLTNSTTSTLSWSAAGSQAWTSVSPSSGALAAGATQDVTVSINGGANALAIGQYGDAILFSNLTLGSSQYRYAYLTVNPPMPGKAINPSPADGATTQPVTTALSWQNGGGANDYYVFFGTSNPPPPVVIQSDNHFYPGVLSYETTYYWRVDSINATGTAIGDTWSFTTRPFVSNPGRTLFVVGSAPSSGDGLSWATAKKTIAEGLAAAAVGRSGLGQEWYLRGGQPGSYRWRHASVWRLCRL